MNNPDFVALLKSLPQRIPRRHEQIVWAFFQTGKPLSAQEVYFLLKEMDEDPPGLSTVYRSIDALADIGFLQRIPMSRGEKRYELCVPGFHHHYLRCDSCQKTIRLDDCVVNDTRAAIEKNHGFEITSHVLEILGKCSDCVKLDDKKRL